METSGSMFISDVYSTDTRLRFSSAHKNGTAERSKKDKKWEMAEALLLAE